MCSPARASSIGQKCGNMAPGAVRSSLQKGGYLVSKWWGERDAQTVPARMLSSEA